MESANGPETYESQRRPLPHAFKLQLPSVHHSLPISVRVLAAPPAGRPAGERAQAPMPCSHARAWMASVSSPAHTRPTSRRCADRDETLFSRSPEAVQARAVEAAATDALVLAELERLHALLAEKEALLECRRRKVCGFTGRVRQPTAYSTCAMPMCGGGCCL